MTLTTRPMVAWHPEDAAEALGPDTHTGNSSEDALEDSLFGVEFDRIRRGSQSSKKRKDLFYRRQVCAYWW